MTLQHLIETAEGLGYSVTVRRSDSGSAYLTLRHPRMQGNKVIRFSDHDRQPQHMWLHDLDLNVLMQDYKVFQGCRDAVERALREWIGV